MNCRSRITAAFVVFLGAFFCGLNVSAQLPAGLSATDGRSAAEPSPPGISMYGVFALITSVDEESPGRGKEVIQGMIGIESEASARALNAYMRDAFYAGHASSSARAREFCERQILTREDLIQALEDQERDHNAELERLVADAANVVSEEEFARLVRYAESRQSQRTLTSFDPRVVYADNGVNVAAEVSRRCDE